MAKLNLSRPPRLPTAPADYEPQFHNQHSDVLRLYFNQLDNAVNNLLRPRGGQFLSFPFGSFLATASQSVAAINTPQHLALDTTDIASGMSLVVGDGVHVETSGVYNIQFSAQLTNYDTQAFEVDIWIRKNGVDAPYTASVVTVPSTHGGQPGYYVLAANFYLQLLAEDYFEFWWSSNSLLTQVQTLPPITTPFASPGSPGFACTVTFVSELST